MKIIILSIAITIVSYTAYSQNAFPSSGNVGIGTTSPNSTLDVHGYASFGGNSGNLDSRNPPGALSFLVNSGQMVVGWNRSQGSGETDFIGNQGAGGAGGFAFYNHDNNNNETQLMWLFANGQLVLGNGQGNQGNYLLAVAGSAVATSFTVKTVANWPDYVFKKEYHLQSLDQLQTYIDLNHHLPDMPSEHDVIKDGINLGEMDKILTKKVEELTLYLIEKDKQLAVEYNTNCQQQQQIANQQQELKCQKARIEKLEEAVLKLTESKVDPQ